MTDTLGWRLTAPLRRLNALRRGGASRRARDGSRPSRRPTARRAIPARTRSLDSRSATANALDSSIRRSRPPGARAPAARARRRSLRDVEDAVGLEPLEQRVAVPRVEDRGRALRPRRVACQTTPKPKNTGTTTSRSRSRSATKSSTAVSTPLRGPPSRAAERGYGSPPRAQPRLAGEQLRRPRRPAGGGASAGSRRRRSSRRAARAASRRRGTAAAAARRPAPARRSAAAPRGP